MSTCDERPLALRDAIERLYLTFGSYSDWSRDSGCPCCVTAAQCEPLLITPLLDLTHGELLHFAELVQSLWGDVDDYRHFLPRLLELCTISADYNWNLDAVVRGLKLGNWQEWADKERSVKEFITCWWQCTITVEALKQCTSCGEEHLDRDRSAQPVLSAIATAYADLQPFLLYWLSCEEKNSFLQFIESWNALATIFLVDEQRQQFVEWLSDARTLQWLQNGLTNHDAEDWSTELLSTIAELQAFNNREGEC